MRKATLVFLIKRKGDGKIVKILLAMKKRGFGKGRWNGVGGKPNPGENITYCAKREANEEIGVKLSQIKEIGIIKFRFKYNKEWDQDVYFYFCENWEGTPAESDEMKPKWFAVDKIPYSAMWPDDRYWMPIALKENKFRGSILFGENDKIIENKINNLELRRKTLQGLMKKTQLDYFQNGIISEGNFNLRTKKFAEFIRDIDREIPLLKEDLVKINRKKKK